MFSLFRYFAFVISLCRLRYFVMSPSLFRLFVFSLSSFRLFAFVFSSFRYGAFVMSPRNNEKTKWHKSATILLSGLEVERRFVFHVTDFIFIPASTPVGVGSILIYDNIFILIFLIISIAFVMI